MALCCLLKLSFVITLTNPKSCSKVKKAKYLLLSKLQTIKVFLNILAITKWLSGTNCKTILNANQNKQQTYLFTTNKEVKKLLRYEISIFLIVYFSQISNLVIFRICSRQQKKIFRPPAVIKGAILLNKQIYLLSIYGKKFNSAHKVVFGRHFRLKFQRGWHVVLSLTCLFTLGKVISSWKNITFDETSTRSLTKKSDRILCNIWSK